VAARCLSIPATEMQTVALLLSSYVAFFRRQSRVFICDEYSALPVSIFGYLIAFYELFAFPSQPSALLRNANINFSLPVVLQQPV
jgi:hypothetical protein